MHTVDSFTQQAGQVGTSTVQIAPFLPSNYRTSPLNSQLYRTYCSLYDEVKCVGFKINVNISSPVGGSEIPALQIYTAFDRKYCNGESAPNYASMKTYSTYQVATAVNNSVAKLTRSIYASDILEKATWHDCTLAENAGTYSDSAYVAAGANCNFFSPAFFICFAVPQQTLQVTINVTYDVTYYYAFRNPKYGAAAGNSKFTMDPVERVTLADDGDMDIDQVDIDAAAEMSANRVARVTTSKTRARDILDEPGPLTAGNKRYPKN